MARSHATCTHAATPKGRAACRAGRELAATTETVTLSTGAVIGIRPAATAETVTLSTGSVIGVRNA